MEDIISTIIIKDTIIVRKIEMEPTEETFKKLGIHSHEEYLEFLADLIDNLCIDEDM